MVETLTRALRGISLSPKPFLIAVDTEGSSRSGGIREIGAAAVDAAKPRIGCVGAGPPIGSQGDVLV